VQKIKKPALLNFSVILLLIFSLSACNIEKNASEQETSKKVTIAASLFPQYDFAKQIFKEKADVFLILPPETESHTFDLTPNLMIKIFQSDVFLYTGKYMEPWAERIVEAAPDTLKIKDVSSGINLIKTHQHEHHGENDNHNHAQFDPHIWLDPSLAAKMAENIKETACDKYPEDSEFFNKNFEELKLNLEKLDKDFKNMIESSKRKEIVFGGRFAHAYFINKYNLKYKSVFSGCSAEAEPSAKRTAKIINFIQENKIPVIFYEEISEPKVANSIAAQTGAKTLRFSTAHNITKKQAENQVSYIDIMRENLENLKIGLN